MTWYNFFHIYQPPAWDEAIIRRVADESYRPVLSILERRPEIKITLNMSGALTEQLLALGLRDVIDRFRSLIARGQVELVGSAMYHPILPLLPTNEVRRQIELQSALHQRIFGVKQPTGFYCPEMAYSPALDQILLAAGFQWVILDEVCGGQAVGQQQLDRPYQAPSGLKVVFRNRLVSDKLAFSSALRHPEQSLATIEQDERSKTALITAMDGENLGHHRHGVDQLWEFLVTCPGIVTDTLSSLAAQPVTPLQPIAGSWSSLAGELRDHIPFGLWNHPDNPIQQGQWDLTYLILKTVAAAEADPYFPAARRLVDRALASDRYWWASARPWWDMPIVIRETQKLADAITPLSSIQASVKNTIERLVQHVITSVELWEQTGLAKRRQATYLQDTGEVRFMAGGQVSS